MIRTTTDKIKPRNRAAKPRAEIAAAVFAGALTLFALADMPARAPAPVAVPVAANAPAPAPAEQAPARLRSASYYPEDLAALQSLRGFQPMANEGEKPAAIALVAPGKAALFDPKGPRRAETKTSVALPTAAPPGQAAQQSPPAPTAEPFKVFGLSLPVDVGAQVNAQVINMRDVAGRWGAAASTLWR
jgi:hypothetical protein